MSIFEPKSEYQWSAHTDRMVKDTSDHLQYLEEEQKTLRRTQTQSNLHIHKLKGQNLFVERMQTDKVMKRLMTIEENEEEEVKQ